MKPELLFVVVGVVPAALGGIFLGVRIYFRRLYDKLAAAGRVT